MVQARPLEKTTQDPDRGPETDDADVDGGDDGSGGGVAAALGPSVPTTAPPVADFSDIRSYSVGQELDVKDNVGTWCEAEVMKISVESRALYVTFVYWSDRWDDWISLNDGAHRLAPLHTFTFSGQPSHFQVGQRVEACDSQGTWLEAFVKDLNVNEVLVHFYKYHSKFDTWLPRTSPRIRQFGRAREYLRNKRVATMRRWNVPSVLRDRTNAANNSKKNNNSNSVASNCSRTRPGRRVGSSSGDGAMDADQEATPVDGGSGSGQMDLEQDNRCRQITAVSDCYHHYANALSERGLAIVPVAGDGNCLFRSVAHQVYGDDRFHATVRACCMDYMQANAAFYSQFVVGGEESFGRYLEAKRQDAVWGDDPEIQAMCELYDLPAEIWAYDARQGARKLRTFHEASSSSGGSGDAEGTSLAIRLSYYGGGHYDSVIRKPSGEVLLQQRQRQQQQQRERERGGMGLGPLYRAPGSQHPRHGGAAGAGGRDQLSMPRRGGQVPLRHDDEENFDPAGAAAGMDNIESEGDDEFPDDSEAVVEVNVVPTRPGEVDADGNYMGILIGREPGEAEAAAIRRSIRLGRATAVAPSSTGARTGVGSRSDAAASATDAVLASEEAAELESALRASREAAEGQADASAVLGAVETQQMQRALEESRRSLMRHLCYSEPAEGIGAGTESSSSSAASASADGAGGDRLPLGDLEQQYLWSIFQQDAKAVAGTGGDSGSGGAGAVGPPPADAKGGSSSGTSGAVGGEIDYMSLIDATAAQAKGSSSCSSNSHSNSSSNRNSRGTSGSRPLPSVDGEVEAMTDAEFEAARRARELGDSEAELLRAAQEASDAEFLQGAIQQSLNDSVVPVGGGGGGTGGGVVDDEEEEEEELRLAMQISIEAATSIGQGQGSSVRSAPAVGDEDDALEQAIRASMLAQCGSPQYQHQHQHQQQANSNSDTAPQGDLMEDDDELARAIEASLMGNR